MIDIDAALQSFLDPAPPQGPWPRGLPEAELIRSPAAARVGQLAARDGLLLAHFEHRAPPDEPEDAPSWQAGVLPEDKYSSFQHELPIGSFHPGHRAKWGAHELCHGLVGGAWRSGAPPLLVATAGRLAELVPVVLWYFLDEIGLRRCPHHTGPLFRTFCPACEQAAEQGAAPIDEARARALLREADTFLERELAAVSRTRRLGRPVSHVWGSIDLCSDGLAYADAHGPRLGSAAFGAWAERFFVDGRSGWSSTEALEARVIAVARAVAEGRPLAPWADDPEQGRARWTAMDLGARLLQIGELTEGEATGALLALVDRLAVGEAASSIAADYAALCGAFVLPPPELVFAVGYPIDGVATRSVERLEEGLQSVVPGTLELCADAGLDPVPAFVAADVPERVPLGERFARWAAGAIPGPAAELARYEAALCSVRAEPQALVLGPGGEGCRLIEGARLLRFPFDPVAFAAAVESGAIEGRPAESGAGPGVGVDTAPGEPTALIVARDRSGELVLVDVTLEDADQIEHDPGELAPEVRDALVGLGLLVPQRWGLV